MPDSPLRSVLLSALHKILTPLVRVMLAHEITLATAVELLKRVFVEVAERDFRLAKKATTDSRISLITGVHRKDVKRLRDLPRIDTELPANVSRSAQIVAAWITNPRWLDDQGQPLPLHRLARHDSVHSFEALVASVNQDIRPRSVLDEWLRQGVVEINANDEVRLLANAFIPQEGMEEKLAYYGHNLGDHAAAASANVLGGARPWFERSVHHDALSQEQVDALRSHAADLGMQMLTRLHGLAEQAAPPSATGDNGDKAGKRFTCGIYFYSADTEVEENHQ